MNNSKVIINRYKSKNWADRNKFKKSCTKKVKITDLINSAYDYYKEHWRYLSWRKEYKESFQRFKEELPNYQEKLFNTTRFEDIITILYEISKKINGKGLAATFHYDFATAIAYHNNVKVNKLYLNTTKTKHAFKNFLSNDYERLNMKFKGHDTFYKEDLHEDFQMLDEDEIEEIICNFAEVFSKFNWERIL